MFRVAYVLIVAAVAWGAFAFGAVYPWAYWPLVVVAFAVGTTGLVMRPRESEGAPLRLTGLAVAFCGFLALGLLQLAPVPLTLLAAVSPEAMSVISQLDLVVAAGGADRHPFSIAPGLTAVGLVLFAANALLVLGCARLFSIRGPRRVAAAIPVIGVALALVGIVQSGLFTGKIYGFWTPLDRGNPFGPFVNRNHFAGWMLMALPLTLGLLCGGIARGMSGVKPAWRDRLLWFSSPDASRLILLSVAAMTMALSLLMTLSRSGILALGVAILVTGAFVVRRQSSGGRAVAVAYLILLMVVTVAWAGTDAIAARFMQTDWSGLSDRRGAWADAIDIASRFPVTGTGLNTYGVATLFYQRHDLARHYSQAHNDFLQLAAEGGLLLTIPAVVCLGFLIVGVRRRFMEESSTRSYWLRVGASTALLAIALQEMVDFSLQMPGNATLFAIICAIALHKTPARRLPQASRPVSTPHS
jgi:O-antigen ligase